MTLAPVPVSSSAPQRRPWRALVALIFALLLGVGAIIVLRHVRDLRERARAARAAALVLDGDLQRLQEAWIVEQLDGDEPEALALAAGLAEAQVARGDYADAPTEEIAVSIRVGAALRDAGELDAATSRLQWALRFALAARSGLWDELLGRTVPDADQAPNARAELARLQLARLQLARGDIGTALNFALEAWNAPRTPAALEKRTTAIADRAFLVAEILAQEEEHARAAEFARIAVDEAPPRDRSHAHVRWSALRFLALAEQRAGGFDEAIELHRTALAAARGAFVDDDPRTANSRYELAFMLHDAGPRFADEALR